MSRRGALPQDCKASYPANVFGNRRRYWCQLAAGHLGPHNDGALATGFVKEWNDPKPSTAPKGTKQ